MADLSTIGIVTGLEAEARLLAGLGCRVMACGGDPTATSAAVRRLAEEGARRLVSFGIAGALDPRLRPGDLVLGSGVALPNGRIIAVDPEWLAQARGKLAQAIPGLVAGRSNPVALKADKNRVLQQTMAIIVDMESHHVAALAAEYCLPFLVLRAVADTAQDDLPEAALVGLDKNGRPAIGPVLRSLLGNPGQMPALIKAAWRTRMALKALTEGRKALTVAG